MGTKNHSKIILKNKIQMTNVVTKAAFHNYRIIEQFGLERTFRGHLAQSPAVSRDIFNFIRLLRAPSSLALNVSRDGALTTSLGNLCQGFTILTVKNFFFISSLNLLSFSVKPLPLVLLQQALLKSLSPSFLQLLKGHNKVSP